MLRRGGDGEGKGHINSGELPNIFGNIGVGEGGKTRRAGEGRRARVE